MAEENLKKKNGGKKFKTGKRQEKIWKKIRGKKSFDQKKKREFFYK